MNEIKTEWMNEIKIECMNERTNEWMNEWMKYLMDLLHNRTFSKDIILKRARKS